MEIIVTLCKQPCRIGAYYLGLGIDLCWFVWSFLRGYGNCYFM